MTTNNNSSFDINAAAANNNDRFSVDYTDHTGHTTEEGLDIMQTINLIIEQSVRNARFAFINGQLFQFQGQDPKSPENLERLHAALTATPNPLITLTGKLKGGEQE